MGVNLVYSDKMVGATIMLSETLACLIILAFTIFFWKNRRLYYHYYTSGIPGPSLWSLMKNAIALSLGKIGAFEIIETYLASYKKLFTIDLGFRIAYVITKPEDIQIVLNRTLHKDSAYDIFKQVLGLSLFTAPVELWKPRRKVIMSTFNKKILDSFVKVFSEQTDILVRKLAKYCGKGCFDIHPLLLLCTLDSICETNGFMIYAQTKEGDYINWLTRGREIVNDRIFNVWLRPTLIWRLCPLSWELDRITEKMKEIVRKTVTDKKLKYREMKKTTISTNNCSESIRKTKAFLDYLVELSEEGANITDEDLVDELALMTIAGTDTSGSVLGFAVVMLGMHNNIQKKAYDEQYEIFGNIDREVTPEDLTRMTYLDRIIKETLRLFPPGVVFSRSLHEDIELVSCTLPKGAVCIMVPFHTQRDPEIWPDPHRYNPDRFLSEEVEKRHPYSFIPFSGGPRNCVGHIYAMMIMKTVLSGIIRRYKISTDFKVVTDIKLDITMMIKSVDGNQVALQDRLVENL